MKNVILLSVLLATVGCGKSSENTAAPLAPSSPVNCSVYDIGAPLSAVPNLDVISPAATLGLSNMTFAQVDEVTPFAQFVGTAVAGVTKQFAMRCKTTINVETSGAHVFRLTSDDGSGLSINGISVINKDGLHGVTTRAATVTLTKGTHTVQVDYFQNLGLKTLSVTVQEPVESL